MAVCRCRHYRWTLWLFVGILVSGCFLFRHFVRNSKPTTEVARVAPSSSDCILRKNIFFMKTHKCASSTVQNVLLRFGAARDLEFVLPTLGNYLGNQRPFSRSMTSNAPWHSLGYNIFCHHTVFDGKEVAAIMPNDTVYVGILRDPVDLFESLYSYARLDLHYKRSIEAFASSRRRDPNAFRDRALGYLGLNQMLYDFGVGPNDFGNTTIVRQALEGIERRFSLIMIAEHFDESMILLKDLLCWSIDDIVYFRHNVRKVETKRRLSEAVRNSLRTMNGADDYLYKYFHRIFWQKVHKFGIQRMSVEVAELRKRNREFLEFCGSGDIARRTRSNSGNERVGAAAAALPELVERLQSRRTDNDTCDDLSLDELNFTNLLKRKQLLKAGMF